MKRGIWNNLWIVWMALAVSAMTIGTGLAEQVRQLDDVVVTATKYETAIKDVPASVTVISGTDTDGDGLRNLPGGGNIALTLLARADLAGTEALLPILYHNLRVVGLTLTVQRVDLSTWILRTQGEQFDLVLFRTTPWGMVMDAGVASGYFDSRRRGGGTLANVTDPVFHDLCDRLLSTTDPVRQVRLQHAIQRYYADHMPALSLCWAVNTYPVRRSWRNLTINQIEGGLLNRQTLADIQPNESSK